MVSVPRWMYDDTDTKQRYQRAIDRMGVGEVDKISFKDLIDLNEKYLFHTSIRANIKYLGDDLEVSSIFDDKNNFGNFRNRVAPILREFVEKAIGGEQGLVALFEERLSEISNGRMESIGEITGETKAGKQTNDCKQVIEVLFETVPLFENESMSNFEIEAKAIRTKRGSSNSNDQSDNFEAKKHQPEIEINSLNTILEGVAGCGKTFYQWSLFDPNGDNGYLEFSPERSETVVFHPSTSYEDFVSGLRPVKDGKFRGKAGIFVELCNRAAEDPENNYLLFIDEINRANTAKVFGDLLMVIEEAKRTPKELLSKYGRAVLTRKEAKELQSTRYEDKDPEHAAVRLQTAVDEVPGISKLPEEPLEYLAVPNNLYIVGTMNSTDRSVGTIDLALRRRFTWHTMEPMTMEQLRGQKKVKHRTDLDQLRPLLSWYNEANEKLYTKVGPDARLGHSYFFQDDKSAQQIAHDLLKQLAEIAYIFHLEDLMTESPFNQTVNGLRLEMPGDGLGKRVIVAIAPTSPDTETPDGGAEPLESSDESSESSADEG